MKTINLDRKSRILRKFFKEIGKGDKTIVIKDKGEEICAIVPYNQFWFKARKGSKLEDAKGSWSDMPREVLDMICGRR